MTWKAACTSSSLPEGGSFELIDGEKIVALFRYQGELFALDGICMHQGGPLAKGKVSNGCVTCPWHGWQYWLKSGDNAVTEKPMLETYAVREDDGNVFIDLP
jgi:nitrite reductase/ring-hydroxylating ferredoxin subunit